MNSSLGAEPGVPPSALILALLRARREMMLIAMIGVAVVATMLLNRGRRWESSVRLTSDDRRLSANMSALAVRLGVSVGGQEITQSPQFFADLAKSRAIFAKLAADTFRVVVGGEQRVGPLVEIYRIGGATPEIRREYLYRRFEKDVTSIVDLKTGIVRVSVRAPTPELAFALAANLAGHLDAFNQASRRTKARSERVFTESRRLELEGQLRQAEDSMRVFVMANREYQSSPSLLLEFQRRLRKIELVQQVFGSVAQANEQARIDEVRDTPVLTIIEPPELPALPLPRGLIKYSILAVLFAVPAGFVAAIARRRDQLFDGDNLPVEWSVLRREMRDSFRPSGYWPL